MSRLFVAALLWASFAVAAPPASKRPAVSSLGAKEDDAEPMRQLPASANDRALFRGLMWAFEPAPVEIRVQAVEDLGLLGDTRALNPLAQLCLDPNSAIARAAIRAVGLIRHPRAEEILRNVVLHPAVGEPAKSSAIGLIPFQQTSSALRFVRQVAAVNTFPGGVLASARKLLSELPTESAR